MLITLVSFGVDLKETLYKRALDYEKAGNYLSALEIYSFLGNYKDAPYRKKKVYTFFLPVKVLLKEEPTVRVAYARNWSSVRLDCTDKKLTASFDGNEIRGKGVKNGKALWKGRSRCSLFVDGIKRTVIPPDVKVELLNYRRKSLLILHLPMELYLEGVLPGEVYTSWPLEVLKAQAVAARTYALFNMVRARERGRPFDVGSTTAYQVFVGLHRKYRKVKKAVEETKGEFLTFEGGIIYAMYHSNSGGKTQSFKDLFGLPLTYLPSVRELCDLRTLRWSSWVKKISKRRVNYFLRSLGVRGKVIDLKVVRNSDGRGRKVIFVLKSGEKVILPLSFFVRLSLKIPSDWFFIVGKSGKDFVLEGRGFGHGLGMSQWGAYCLARKGWNYKRILTYYYGPVKIEKLY